MMNSKYFGDYILLILLAGIQIIMIPVKALFTNLSWWIVFIPAYIAVFFFSIMLTMYCYHKSRMKK
jgi:membrane protein implicated in regulation of membrane protease activity